MCDRTIDLPASPEGFQRIGWHGIALVIPETWNLRMHDGAARAGALFFTDLRGTRLEIRWRTPKDSSALDASLSRLRKSSGSQIEMLSPTAARIGHHGAINLMLIDDRRLYELHFPAHAAATTDASLVATAPAMSSPTLLTTITDDFLQTMPMLAGREQWYWSIYGTTGWVPAGARLAKATLLPGASTLSFTRSRCGGKLITLGAYSMADRLLNKAGSLRRWATSAIPLVARHPNGRWEESAQGAIFTADARRLFRLARHQLSLHHDPVANRIAWTHRLERVFR